MKKFTLALLVVSASFAAALEPELHPDRLVYLHGFRSPSIGAEVRNQHLGIHLGLYTTILGDEDNKSTEFIKAGGTYYFGKSTDRQESFGGVSYLRGLNRNYEQKNAMFVEFGTRFSLGRGFDLRFGSGLLLAESNKPRYNPTIGISYRTPLK